MSNMFLDWWDSNESPRRTMPETTAEQVKWVAREAFNAGNHQRHLRQERKRSAPSNFKLED